MNKIIRTSEAMTIAKKLRQQNKPIVLVGGFFDILHIGHIKFLQKAKEKGDILFVLLESDEMAKKSKGENRPINTQSIRAEVLSSINHVNYVVILPMMKNNSDYDRLVSAINPNFIAVTENDKNIMHKQRQAKIIGANVLTVISEVENKSTTKIAKIIEEENNL